MQAIQTTWQTMEDADVDIHQSDCGLHDVCVIHECSFFLSKFKFSSTPVTMLIYFAKRFARIFLRLHQLQIDGKTVTIATESVQSVNALTLLTKPPAVPWLAFTEKRQRCHVEEANPSVSARRLSSAFRKHFFCI